MNILSPKPELPGAEHNDVIVSIFPNPTNGAIVVRSTSNGRMSISSIDGKDVASFSVAAGETNITLPSGLSEGVYMCRYVGENGEYLVVKLVYKP
jgi:hypothetical protein